MPLSGTIPDTPDYAVLVFEVKNGDPVAVTRGLAAAHAVFALSEVGPHIALMAQQEVSNLAIDVFEASSYLVNASDRDPQLEAEWGQKCMDAEVWSSAQDAALLAYCMGGPEQKIHYTFYMAWDGHKLDLEDEALWPHVSIAESKYLTVQYLK